MFNLKEWREWGTLISLGEEQYCCGISTTDDGVGGGGNGRMLRYLNEKRLLLKMRDMNNYLPGQDTPKRQDPGCDEEIGGCTPVKKGQEKRPQE